MRILGVRWFPLLARLVGGRDRVERVLALGVVEEHQPRIFEPNRQRFEIIPFAV
jgi:hypothetical protein